MKKFLLLTTVAGLLSGCYHTEDDDYLHTVPTSNNDTLIEDSGRSQMPMPTKF